MQKYFQRHSIIGGLLMMQFLFPGIYIDEASAAVKPIIGVTIDTAAFIGMTRSGDSADRRPITSYAEFEQRFGKRSPIEWASGTTQTNYLAYAVNGFFVNGGRRLYVVKIAEPTLKAYNQAIEAAGKIPDVGTVVLPGYSSLPLNEYRELNQILWRYAETWRDRMVLLDPPPIVAPAQLASLINLTRSEFLALYYPWCQVREGRVKAKIAVPPSGFVAGVMARVDETRGVYKAPAGEAIQGISGFTRNVSEQEQAVLNPQGINVLHSLPDKGHLVRGARTLSTDPEWKYISIRRYAIYLERSISNGIQWAVFEPNSEQLWTMLRSSITNFLDVQWRQGAMQGKRPQDAYFVRVDRTTMTQADIDQGRVIIQVGYAPLKPAEFVLLRVVLQTRK